MLIQLMATVIVGFIASLAYTFWANSKQQGPNQGIITVIALVCIVSTMSVMARTFIFGIRVMFLGFVPEANSNSMLYPVCFGLSVILTIFMGMIVLGGQLAGETIGRHCRPE